MWKWKSFAVAALGVSAFSLFAFTPDMVISVDGEAVVKHPQLVKYRAEFDAKAEAAGEKTLAQMLEEGDFKETMLRNRIAAYINMESKEGVCVVDTAEGKAPELFEFIRKSFDFKDGGTESEISGCRAVSGDTAGGKRIVILLRSPSQIQIQVDGTGGVPLDFSKINKNLILAAKSDRLFNVAAIPSAQMTANPGIPQLQSLRMVTLGVENTEPEAELVLEGQFNDNDSALMIKGMLDVMVLAGQQNPAVDGRLLKNIRSSAADGKVSFRRTVDQEFIDGVTAQVQSALQPRTGTETGAKTDGESAPVAEPAAQ